VRYSCFMSNRPNEVLAEYWRTVLFNKDLTIKELSKASGVSYATARYVVGGLQIPTDRTLQRLCAAVGTDWKALRQEMYAHPAADETDPKSAPAPAVTEEVTEWDSPPVAQITSTHWVRDALLAVFDTLPIAGQVEAVGFVMRLQNKYRSSKRDEQGEGA
jgi:transcriptional regulator with XRE-family HTH domain